MTLNIDALAEQHYSNIDPQYVDTERDCIAENEAHDIWLEMNARIADIVDDLLGNASKETAEYLRKAFADDLADDLVQQIERYAE